jgi:4-amino-4-deoxy-L-arabinose transferase-like glycosyltransferase
LLRDSVARLFLLAALLIRLMFAYEVIAHDLDLSSNDQLDMIFLHQNAAQIASGDIRLVHPVLGHYADLRNKIYGPERYDRLFKPETYIDSPGYLYFAGACEAFTFHTLPQRPALAPSPYSEIVVQLLLDAFGCALVYSIARRTYGLAEARVALAACALCLECVGEAGFVLRESLIAFLVTASVYTLERARNEGPRSWILAGIVWGLGWSTKLTFVFLLPFVPFIAGRKPRRLAAFALGAVLPVLPFAARNVSLGIPPFQMSATSLQIIAQRNMAGYEGVGERVGRHEEIRRILDASDETSLGVLAAAIRSHEHPLTDYPEQLGRKLFYFFAPIDFWNNIRVSYLRLLSPFLALCVVWWGVLSPFALVGFVRAWTRRETLPLAAAFLALGIAPALVAGVYTRYRMVIEPISCVLFAATIVAAARGIHRGRLRWAGLVLALLAARVGVEARIFGWHGQQLPKAELVRYVTGTWPNKQAAMAYLLERVERSGAP